MGTKNALPGPWEVCGYSIRTGFNEDKAYDRYLVCEVSRFWPHEQVDATRNLIAAAPSLYDSLFELVRCLRAEEKIYPHELGDALSDAETDLAKARGENSVSPSPFEMEPYSSFEKEGHQP